MNRKIIAMLVLMLANSGTAMAMDIPQPNSPGARLYANRCAVCHSLPHPKRLTWPAWRHTLHLMQKRIQQSGMPEPGKQEWRRIAAYLKRNAR